MQPTLKIVEPGWEGYTGPLFGMDFVDGKSTGIYSQQQGEQVSNLLRVETSEGKNLSITQAILDSKLTPMAEDKKTEFVAPVVAQVVYSVEALQAIADEKGIEGLREIAKDRNLKDNSIAGLIAKILTAQMPPKPAEITLQADLVVAASVDAPAAPKAE